MTSQTVGSPDWLKPTATVDAPVQNGAYAGAGTSETFGPFDLVGYTHVAIAWQPTTNQFMNVRQLDQNGNVTIPNMVKQIICPLGATARITCPVLLGKLDVNVNNIGGAAGINGNLTVSRFNGSDRRDAIQGPLPIVNRQSVVVAGGGVDATDSALVAEGPATAFLLSSQAGGFATIRALNTIGTGDAIAQLANTAANVPIIQPLWIPPRQIHVDMFNQAGVAATMYFALIVGG